MCFADVRSQAKISKSQRKYSRWMNSKSMERDGRKGVASPPSSGREGGDDCGYCKQDEVGKKGYVTKDFWWR